MNENINLCNILKGHEGETFYCSLIGENVKLVRVGKYIPDSYKHIVVHTSNNQVFDFWDDGSYIRSISGKNTRGEMQLFPSKDQRDWIKWDKENNHDETPKTWSELVKENKYKPYYAEIHIRLDSVDKSTCGKSPIEKSALALLKIHQLIEVGYGGNITNEEWLDGDDVYVIGFDGTEFRIFYNPSMIHTLAFRTEEQAEEFLKYEENIQLLKDYFMI